VTKIVPAKNDQEKPKVELDDGTCIECDLLIGSDGERSRTRNDYKIGAWGYSYTENELTCTV
jgi:2-polyprenyl-6-methoxyphenol hydroxylase-like FAD-dependent oxidoreductase